MADPDPSFVEHARRMAEEDEAKRLGIPVEAYRTLSPEQREALRSVPRGPRADESVSDWLVHALGAKQVSAISKAPPPIKPLRGSRGPAVPSSNAEPNSRRPVVATRVAPSDAPHRWSWELPLGPEREAAEQREADHLGMSRSNYVQLQVAVRKAKFGTATKQTEKKGTECTKLPRELHATDVAIILMFAGGAFCAGLFGYYESHPILGTIFIIGSIAMTGPISPFVRSRAAWLGSRPVLLAVGISIWLFLGVDIYLKLEPNQPAPTPVQQEAANLPTSPEGLKPGTVWNNNGVLSVTPFNSAQRLLTSVQKQRLVIALTLGPRENYSFQINSAPNCDECEVFAEDIRGFLNTIPGWRAGGGPLTLFDPKELHGMWLISRPDEVDSGPVSKLRQAFSSAGLALTADTEKNFQKGTFVIVIARQDSGSN